jgi:hypothetical protein
MVLIGGSSGIVGGRAFTTAVEPVVTLILDAARGLAPEFDVAFDLEAVERGRGSVALSAGVAAASP